MDSDTANPNTRLVGLRPLLILFDGLGQSVDFRVHLADAGPHVNAVLAPYRTKPRTAKRR